MACVCEMGVGGWCGAVWSGHVVCMVLLNHIHDKILHINAAFPATINIRAGVVMDWNS